MHVVGTRRLTQYTQKVSVERSKADPRDFVGWISEKHRIAWVVSRYRQDKRTGAIKQAKPEEKVYLLEYSARDLGGKRGRANFMGIAAKNHTDAIKKAHTFMDSINLAQIRRHEATLYYGEREVDLWIGKRGSAVKGK
ncbi:hypothetical protein [Paenibacillus agilis]|uniref:Uncharacterized protein n=1 Tax=Paenibacillus agilis TaxID=3020863 RepID=A0A559IXC9_9BACL|nr:hypothetical protein [Paenibacillus agilis]TVX92263.1 hypothetical protein FPZ44_03810 [Paenibacillus agilis]